MRAIFRWLREGVIGLDSTRSISGRLGMRYDCGTLFSIMSNGLWGGANMDSKYSYHILTQPLCL